MCLLCYCNNKMQARRCKRNPAMASGSGRQQLGNNKFLPLLHRRANYFWRTRASGECFKPQTAFSSVFYVHITPSTSIASAARSSGSACVSSALAPYATPKGHCTAVRFTTTAGHCAGDLSSSSSSSSSSGHDAPSLIALSTSPVPASASASFAPFGLWSLPPCCPLIIASYLCVFLYRFLFL